MMRFLFCRLTIISEGGIVKRKRRMIDMKKLIALALAGTMVFSVPVMAEEVGAPVGS